MLFDKPITKWRAIYQYSFGSTPYLVFARAMKSGLLQFKTIVIGSPFVYKEGFWSLKIDTQQIFDELISEVQNDNV